MKLVKNLVTSRHIDISDICPPGPTTVEFQKMSDRAHAQLLDRFGLGVGKSSTSNVKWLEYLHVLVQRTVLSWTGFEGEDGTPLECNDVNKQLLLDARVETTDDNGETKMSTLWDVVFKRNKEQEEAALKN